MTNEGTALARRFAVDVSTDGVNWVPFKGIQDFAPAAKDTVTSVADYDTNGFDSYVKTLTSWSVTVKAKRPTVAGVFDPGQEMVRATMFQFGDAGHVYVRWYDRNGAPEAWSGWAIPDWQESKTAVSDPEEITVKFQGDGAATAITNPAGASSVPVITSALPGGAAVGAQVTVQGAHFTGTTGIKMGTITVTEFTQVSDSLIVLVIPATAAGSSPIVVTNATGPSAAFAYTV